MEGSQPCLTGLEAWKVNVARRLPDAQWVSVHPVIIPAVMRDKMHACVIEFNGDHFIMAKDE